MQKLFSVKMTKTAHREAKKSQRAVATYEFECLDPSSQLSRCIYQCSSICFGKVYKLVCGRKSFKGLSMGTIYWRTGQLKRTIASGFQYVWTVAEQAAVADLLMAHAGFSMGEIGYLSMVR